MQYMSFRACASPAHSKASAIFARNFVFCKYTKCYRKCKFPAGKKTHEPLPFHTYILSSLATKLPVAYAKSPHNPSEKTFAMT